MNRYSQHFTYSLLATLLGLPLGCLVAGLLYSLYELVVQTGDAAQFPKSVVLGLSTAWIAAFVGLLPAFVYGVPVYAWLSWKNSANMLSAFCVGALPGALMLSAEPVFAALVLLFGTCVALTTHLLVRKRLALLREPSTGAAA